MTTTMHHQGQRTRQRPQWKNNDDNEPYSSLSHLSEITGVDVAIDLDFGLVKPINSSMRTRARGVDANPCRGRRRRRRRGSLATTIVLSSLSTITSLSILSSVASVSAKSAVVDDIVEGGGGLRRGRSLQRTVGNAPSDKDNDNFNGNISNKLNMTNTTMSKLIIDDDAQDENNNNNAENIDDEPDESTAAAVGSWEAITELMASESLIETTGLEGNETSSTLTSSTLPATEYVSSNSYEEEGPKRKSAVGYYTPQKFYERNGLSRPEFLDFQKLTRVNYDSFRTDEEGNVFGSDSFVDPLVLFGPVDWTPKEGAKKYCHKSKNEKQLTCQTYQYEKGLIGGAHMNGCHVYPTIGGNGGNSFADGFAGDGDDDNKAFKVMMGNPMSRRKFAKSCVFLIENYDFDGIDLGWSLTTGSPQDLSNFNLLLTEVRQALDDLALENGHRPYGLTAELPCGGWQQQQQQQPPDDATASTNTNFYDMDVTFLNSILTEIHLKTYDFYIDGIAYVNSPLHGPGGGGGNLDSISGCVGSYLSRGAKKEKMTIALPFFGKSFVGAQTIGEECQGGWSHDCSDALTWVEDKGSPQYYHIYEKLASMTTSFDEHTKTLYATNDKGVLSYDNEYSTCLKTEYALGMGLNGVVVRDLAGDFLDDSSTPLLDAMHAKLTNPTLQCDSKELWEATIGLREVVNMTALAIAAAEEKEAEESKEVPTSGYMYMCGIGEVDAGARCNSNMRITSSCPGGLGDCQFGETCFLVFCEEPLQVVVDKEEEELEPMTLEIANEGFDPANQAFTEESYQHTCGFGEGDAHTRCNSLDWVDIPCTGLTHCPDGMLCFWTKCNKPETFVKPQPKPKPKRKPGAVGSITAERRPMLEETTGESGSSSITTTTTTSTTTTTTSSTTTSFTGVLYLQFKCGETRDHAAGTCSEDCSSSWGCPPGKSCYSVPCPWSH